MTLHYQKQQFNPLIMKKIILLLSLILTISIVKINAQTQTVCTNSTNMKYDVNPSAGSTYSWSLKNGLGTITTISGRTDSILINYGSITGTDTLRVVEIGPTGCIGDTAKYRILVLPNLVAAISGTDSICINSASIGKLRVSFTGNAGPWNMTYSDGVTPVTVNGITTSPYFFNSSVYGSVGIRTFTITSLTSANICAATIVGSATVRVFPKPGIITINTY